ncbi:MAG TPA: ATP-binding protein, partial [Acidimicrobiales bacterium]|nr:ATP-binding protein [Acidimicrobiales bacterium]
LDGIPAPVGHAGFRIVQESLTNVMRHSTAATATVRVSVTQSALTVEVADDGSPEAGKGSEQPGHGVEGMKERARAVGGTVDAGPRDDEGWRVRACLPVTERSQ